MVPREIAVSVSNKVRRENFVKIFFNLQKISLKVDIGDWWIIYMLGRNLDPIIYRDVLADLAKSITVPPKKSKN
jgi:hypothetical protein